MKLYAKLLVLAALFIGSRISACQLIFTNDVNEIVTISPVKEDGKTSKAQSITLMPGAENKEYGDPHERAHFTLSTNGKQYQLKQIACSGSHEIKMSVSEVLNRNLSEENSKLFELKPQ